MDDNARVDVIPQWYDNNPRKFTRTDRAHTTILFGGLTILQDQLLEAGMESIGYKIQPLDCPDNASLQIGKEFGNRAQCNPTYFTVGNLVKHLKYLHEEEGLSKEKIIKDYLFLTSGSCGPCRFGMYATEYRKALRDSGFEGFRIMTFETSEGISQDNEDNAGLEITPQFFFTFVRCAVAGDVLNAMGYRIRPYEVEEGMTDKALAECRDIVKQALRNKKSMLFTLYKCRRILKKVKVNRLQAKPKVAIIGEFWAMTTEGEGNYFLQRYLESEGAEVDIQLLTNWILYLLWEAKYDTRQTSLLHNKQEEVKEGIDFKPMKKMFTIWMGSFLLKNWFYAYAKVAGLKKYHLSDMDELAKISDEYYSNELRGGEGHMEVAKLIKFVTKKKAHMVISVKPFGCMPSSGVSDGIQSLITARFPDANFLPIETSGDGAVNVYSRIQMALYRARIQAQEEFNQALENKDSDTTKANRKLQKSKKWQNGIATPKHKEACTAANLVYNM